MKSVQKDWRNILMGWSMSRFSEGVKLINVGFGVLLTDRTAKSIGGSLGVWRM